MKRLPHSILSLLWLLLSSESLMTIYCFWPLKSNEIVDANLLALDVTQVGAQGKFSSLYVSSSRILCIAHSASKEAAAVNLLTEKRSFVLFDIPANKLFQNSSQLRALFAEEGKPWPLTSLRGRVAWGCMSAKTSIALFSSPGNPGGCSLPGFFSEWWQLLPA